jgi:hypothetical protein
MLESWMLTPGVVEVYPRVLEVHPEVVYVQAIARSSDEIKEQHINAQNSLCHTVVVFIHLERIFDNNCRHIEIVQFILFKFNKKGWGTGGKCLFHSFIVHKPAQCCPLTPLELLSARAQHYEASGRAVDGQGYFLGWRGV